MRERLKRYEPSGIHSVASSAAQSVVSDDCSQYSIVSAKPLARFTGELADAAGGAASAGREISLPHVLMWVNQSLREIRKSDGVSADQLYYKRLFHDALKRNVELTAQLQKRSKDAFDILQAVTGESEEVSRRADAAIRAARAAHGVGVQDEGSETRPGPQSAVGSDAAIGDDAESRSVTSGELRHAGEVHKQISADAEEVLARAAAALGRPTTPSPSSDSSSERSSSSESLSSGSSGSSGSESGSGSESDDSSSTTSSHLSRASRRIQQSELDSE